MNRQAGDTLFTIGNYPAPEDAETTASGV